ncbi:hypothetical protein HELRODRAFT_193319 [Helobdella robusta]|uniref:RAP domain-containing protein n=1 Tax=Helobdella robusta TaxID=6412 RepID=T1FUV7_HELRO|nr:hypothetical protein HELRODRAFT_193319 [Helobdella robusta]ESN97247.1 hypothetical protein HELRODRAFT_193319 [Helobdella robusta]
MSIIVKSLRELCQKNVSAFLLLNNLRTVENLRRLNRNNLSIINRLRSTLGQSFVLVQDGIEITELPWVVKRLGPSEFMLNGKFNVENAPYDSNELRLHDDHDLAFARMLQECNSVKQVFQLLEVPGETVTSQSAAFALCRICSLKNKGGTEDIDSFIRKAILNELCDTVVKDIKHLPNQTLISLVRCCVSVNNYEQSFIESVNEEVERRIGSSTFTVSDLCELITCMSESVRSDVNTLKMCWIHLGMKFNDINEKNIVEVFQVLRNITPEFRYMLRLADKQLQTCWWKLVAKDISSICKNLCLLNFYSGRTLSSFGKWMYANVHTLDDDSMKHILGMYSHFNYSDSNVITSLEKFISAFSRRTARGKNPPDLLNRVLMSMAANFCKRRRLISTSILDSIAADFTLVHQSGYDLREGLSVLKSFGQLGYIPSSTSSSEFFSAAEHWTQQKLNRIPFSDLLELLASFVYIERFPVNFVDRVLNAQIKDPIVRQRACRHLLEIQASYLLEFPTRRYLSLFEKDALKISLTWMDGRLYKFHKDVGALLKDLLVSDIANECQIPRNTPHLINYELMIDAHENVAGRDSFARTGDGRVALLLMMPECYSNGWVLMGEFSMKRRHLVKLGYAVVMVQYELFSWKNRSTTEKINYLKSLLTPYVKLK